MKGLIHFAGENAIDAASFTALGAFSEVTLGYFDMERKEYEKIPIPEQVEVLSLIGTIAPKEDGGPQVHAHAVIGRHDGTTLGGHLIEGYARPILEVTLTEAPAHLRREVDPETGLALLKVEE